MLALLVFLYGPAAAQTQSGPIRPLPPPGSSGAQPIITPMLSQPDVRNQLWHRDSLGRPCLEIKAETRSQPATPNIFDHVVAVNNRCLERIKVKLCYYKSDRCYLVELAANQRKETILGTFPAMRYFRYEYQEQR
jgi:hypothetical protein